MPDRLILRGGALLALDGRAPLRRTDLLIEGDRIAAIGGVPTKGAEVETIRGVVMPGLVQAHLHLDLSLQGERFVPEPDPAVHHRVQRAAWTRAMAPEAARSSAQAGLAWSLAAGATTVADPSSVRHGLAALSAAQSIGVRTVLFVDARKRDAAEALVVLQEALAAQDLERQTSVALWVGEAERTPRAALGRAGALSKARSLPLVAQVGLLPGDRGAVERLERAGALGKHTVLTHAHGASLGSERSLRRLAEAKASVVATPGFEVLTGAPPAPLVALLEAGVPVGLGSEGGASRLGLDLFAEARLALRQLEGRVSAPATTALEMATRDGARALGLTTGSIEVGRAADLLVFAIEAEEGDDQESMARRILESAGPEHMREIWVGGTRRLGERGARRAPAADVLSDVRGACAAHVEADMASWTGKSWAVREVVRQRVRRWRGWHRGVWP